MNIDIRILSIRPVVAPPSWQPPPWQPPPWEPLPALPPPRRNPYTVAGFCRAVFALAFWIAVIALIRGL
jgi:hypothetical protein